MSYLRQLLDPEWEFGGHFGDMASAIIKTKYSTGFVYCMTKKQAKELNALFQDLSPGGKSILLTADTKLTSPAAKRQTGPVAGW